MGFYTWLLLFLQFWGKGAQSDIISSITHQWTFNNPSPYKDSVSRQDVLKLFGTTSNNTDYLSLVGFSCLILGSFTDLCLTNMSTCDSGFSLAFWLLIKHTATDPQIFLGTSGNDFTDLKGVFVYQNETNGTERKVIVEVKLNGHSWKEPLKIQHEIWNFIVITWNAAEGRESRLATYINGELVNSSVVEKKSDVWKHIKLKGHFPKQVVRAELYLESGGLYDEVITWNRSLHGYEVRRAFQSQMNELSKIHCAATATTLNVTWKVINRKLFQIKKTKNRITVWRNKTHAQVLNKVLDYSTDQYFVENLAPYTPYKIRLRREDSKDRRCLGALLCRTKQGVPSVIQNLTIASYNSTSLLVQWSPPLKINGIIRGYNIELKLSNKGSRKRLIAVEDAESYLITGLMTNTEYAIAVQGFTSAGNGPMSQTKKARTKKVPLVTEKPKNVTAIALSSDVIKVTWIPLDQREEVQSYEVEYCSIVNCTRKRVGKTADVLLKSLPQYTAFKVQVRGRNTQYAGPWEMARRMTTLDFDECTQQPCHGEATCKNMPGLYECRCKKGFTGDGFNWCEVDPAYSSDDDFCQEELFRNITWLQTPRGKTIQRGCPYGFSGWANRSCSSKIKASWHKPDLTNCVSEEFRELQLQITSKNEIGSDTAADLAHQLLELTNPTRERLIVSGDLSATVGMLELLDQKTRQNASMNQEKASSFLKNLVNVASNLLDEKTMDAWQDSPVKSRSDEATKLLMTMESVALKTASFSNSTNTSSFNTSNIVLKFRSIKEEDSIAERVIFSALDDGSGSKIEMPTSELQRNNNSTSSGAVHHIAFVYMKNIEQLLLTSSRFFNPTRGVISLSTNPKSSSNFTDPVVIFFHNNQKDVNPQPSCFFWKISKFGHSWSSEGCYVNFKNSTVTVCHCYHLTSFSVLMEYTTHSLAEGTNQIALGLVTYIGISISLISLLLAFVTFCSFGFLKSNRNFAHINLVLSLFLAELLFVVGTEKTQYKTGCFIIAILLHYLFLVSFCWMATEGVILYVMLVKVFPTSGQSPRKRLFFICSWGIPLIPVVTSFLIDMEGYVSERHCWLSVEEGFIWSFVGPVLLICMVNLVFLGMTLKVMATRSLNQPSRNPPQMRYWVKVCAVLTCLLGTTWLLGMFSLDKATVLFAYLFNIFNTLQGLFIFIFHCLADERIRSEYKRILCCRGSRRDHLRDNVIAKSQLKYSSSQTTRLQRKAIIPEEKRLNVGTHTSSGIEQRPVDQGFHGDMDVTAATRTIEHEKAMEYQHNHLAGSDEEHDQEDNEDENSDDVFFEDISSSLINIRKSSTTEPVRTREKRRSVTSDPCQDKPSQFSDQESDTFAYNNEKEELLYIKTMGLMANQPQTTSEGERDPFGDFSLDFQTVESSYQMRKITSTRRVYRYCKNSFLSTSSRRPQIEMSDSSVLRDDLRANISMIENNDTDSVFDGNFLTKEVTCHDERLFPN